MLLPKATQPGSAIADAVAPAAAAASRLPAAPPIYRPSLPQPLQAPPIQRSQAVPPLFAPAPPLQGSATLQMGKYLNVNVRTGGANAGSISGVNFKKWRPTSNSKKQGQHYTAYVMTQDAMVRRVRNRTVTAAARKIRNMATKIGTLPGMQGNHANYLHAAILNVQNSLTGLANNAGGQLALEEGMTELLRIRNKVPGTTIVATNTGGHGESNTSGILFELEAFLEGNPGVADWTQKQTRKKNPWPAKPVVSAQARHMIWRLLDYNPPAATTPVKIAEAGRKVATHFRGLRDAYKQVDNWLNSRGEYLFDYLRANHGAADLPMGNLTILQINAVEAYVAANP